MIKKSVLFVPLVLLASAFAQNEIRQDTIQAGSDGKFETAPDTALVQFDLNSQRGEMKQAYADAQVLSDKIRGVLRSNGIDPKDAEISALQMAPTYDWINGQSKLTGYRVSSHVRIKVKDFQKLPGLVESFSDVEKGGSLNLSYTLDNPDAAKAKAVEDAFRKAHANAEALARAAERQLGPLVFSSVDSNEYVPVPRPMMMRAQAKTAEAASPMQDFTPEKITVTAHVNAYFQLK